MRPTVLHFTGHRISGGTLRTAFLARQEKYVAAEISRALAEIGVVAAFGSLAAGADLLIAEALVARRIPLHLMFPYNVRTFSAVSVAPSGKSWLRRFDRILPQAATVKILPGRPGRDAAFVRCSRDAMDRAQACAAVAGAGALQLAVWDGRPTAHAAGTAVDVAQWKARGLPTRVIAPVPAAHA